ncbi:DUF309 domain-containing protein [Fictibacillus enclensis]|jgi:predicted metal-dependent hydrolase|uniref:DUF309 domain-containing protein n=1 Tax=Fictibacillus enclensis TaxID=1017270 RepID=UPI0024BFF08B|nr:DUF309 domain-containing protein [Fictibacillus enclensis]WHY70309.1 DUF309 domain-containing protein [Fictibacillus enclensis]
MYPEAYIDFLAYFHGTRDYFECHEVLEEHWKKEGMQNDVWVGLIQIAVSLYHQRRSNYEGARRMMESAIKRLNGQKDNLTELGLDHSLLLDQLKKRLSDISTRSPYTDMNLPVTDEGLLDVCCQSIMKHGSLWGAVSDMDNDQIIHKHRTRDRSEIIREREAQKKRKNKTAE